MAVKTMNKKKNIILSLALTIPMLASCQEAVPSSSNNSDGGESSSTPAQVDNLSFKAAEGNFAFPSISEFPVAKSELPALAEKTFVAFVAVSTKYDKCWAWKSDANNTNLTGGTWPGVTLSDKYNNDWYQISFENLDEVNIIFSINGGAQTADMKMTHPGYWWFWESDHNMHDDVPITSWLDSASFVDGDTIRVVGSKKLTAFSLFEGNEKVLEGHPTTNAIDIEFGNRPWDIEKGYRVSANLEGVESAFEMDVAIQKLFNEDSFNAKYAYDGDDLGVTYTTSKSTFKVWSPFSSEINVKVYANGTPTSVDASKGSDQVEKTVAMNKGAKGVWSAEIEGNLAGKYY
ncbi:MAG: starch-binding protein, partial [Bacilli bacterium]|nr:starch-binding protein [Bacilli bacterium]